MGGREGNRCDDCEAMMINGIYYHEIGCPTAAREKREREQEREGEYDVEE